MQQSNWIISPTNRDMNKFFPKVIWKLKLTSENFKDSPSPVAPEVFCDSPNIAASGPTAHQTEGGCFGVGVTFSYIWKPHQKKNKKTS